MNWDMRPLNGVGPLRFGMTPKEVGAVLDSTGAVSASVLEEGGFTREVRGPHLPICQYKNGKLFMVDTHVGVPQVNIYGEDVYSVDPQHLLQLLERQNGGAKAWYGFIVFNRIGVNTESFYSTKNKAFFQLDQDKQDDRGIALYQPSPDTEMPDMTAISFLLR